MDPLSIVLGVSALFCVGATFLYQTSTHRETWDARKTPTQTPESSDVQRVVLVGFLLRIGAVFVIGIFGLSDFFAPDRIGYEISGREIAERWTSGIAIVESPDTLRLYHFYNAVCFYLFGEFAPWFAKIGNAAAGSTAIFVTYRVAEAVFDRRTALRAAWFVALMPSMILWSAVNIRDAWAILAILWTVIAAVRLREQVTPLRVASLLLAFALLGGVRGYMFLIIATGILLSYSTALGGNLVRNYAAGLIAAVVLVYLYSSLGFGRDLVEQASFESLNAQRAAFTQSASSAYHEGVDISTPSGALAFLPIGVSYFLFAPFPWSYSNFRQAVTLPEMIVWWTVALRFLLPGIAEGFRRSAANANTVLSVALLAIIVYGLVEGNVGTAYRHRAQILPLLLVFAAGGWELQRARITRAQPSAA